MKVVFVLSCLLLASGQSLAASDDLTNDLTEFIELLPQDDIKAIFNKYENNAEFVGILKYVFESDDFKQLVREIEAIPEYILVLRFFDESGLDIYRLMDVFHEAIGLPPLTIPVPLKYQRDLTRGVVEDICQEIRDILPKDKIKELHQEKLRTSEAFETFIERMNSTDLMRLITDLILNDDFTMAIQKLNEQGIDLVQLLDLYAEIVGLV